MGTIKYIVIGLVLIVIHQLTLSKINSILLMELAGLALFCYLRYRYLRTSNYARRRADHFGSVRYNRPKVYKPWREYRSKVEVSAKTWIDYQLEEKK